MTATAGNGWVKMKMDVHTINAADAAGRAVMSEEKKYVSDESKSAPDWFLNCIEPAQASAAPEQEPVYQLRNTAVGNVWRDADKEAYESAADLAEYERRKLYTHADPSEVAQLRAIVEASEHVDAHHEKQLEILKTNLEAATQRADAAERNLGAAVNTLKFYADGDHLQLADPDAWDTCSGEPQNFLHDEAGTASIEDGSIAKVALEGLLSASAEPAESIATLMAKHRIAVTPEHDGQWHADLYADEAEPLFKAEGDTPEQAVRNVLMLLRGLAKGGDGEVQS